MIGCKVMRTLASVEIEIILILRLACCLSSSSSMRCLENVGCLPQCLLTQRFPPRLTELRAPECPYHFLRILVRLLGMLIWMGWTLSPRLPRTLTAWMVVRVPPVMSPGLSAIMEEVAAMCESTFYKRFRSSYESSPSSSPPDLPSWKRYRGTSELVEDDEDDDNEEEDKEIEESLDSESMSEDAEDEGPAAQDEDPAAWDESLAAGDEAPSDGLGLGEDEEAVPESQQRAVLVVETADRVLDLHPSPRDQSGSLPAQTPPSLEWSSGSLPISPSHSIVPSPISSLMIPLTVPSPIDTPVMAEIEGLLTELGAQGENQELRLQLAEERRVRLELAEIVGSMRRGQESRGDV
ncbi:hypothetical protein Tco_0910520 [Tanacetum coccineum]|uniref:Uncharacterized protein n=1 Tax=Tanacetum coccineum TaxID=301880 RepID=A0ABQ5CT63_9ASTR